MKPNADVDPDPLYDTSWSEAWLLLHSVVDPNTLNLDPDTGFWFNLDPDPDPSPDPDLRLLVYYTFWKKKLKLILEKKLIIKKEYFLKNYKKKMSHKEMITQLSLNCEFTSYIFCFHIILFFTCVDPE